MQKMDARELSPDGRLGKLQKSRGGCQRHRNGTLEAHHQDDDDIGTHDTAKTHYTKILSLN